MQIYCGDNAMGRFTVGVKLCLLDGNGGVRVAWVWCLHKTYKTYKTYKIMVGRHVIPRGFACAAVWVGSGADLPLGKTGKKYPRASL